MKSFISTVALIILSTIAFSQTNTPVKRSELTKTAIPIQKEIKTKDLPTNSFKKTSDNQKENVTKQIADRPKQNKK